MESLETRVEVRNMVDTGARFVPELVGLRIRINQHRVRRLRAAGISIQRRSFVQELNVINRHVDAAELVGVDPMRANRRDAVGTPRPDSGRPIFGWAKDGRVNAGISKVESDLRTNGFVLRDINILQKEGDKMAFVCLWFAHQAQVAKPVVLNDQQTTLLQLLTGKTYGHLHGFRNPDRSVTLNVAHMEDGPAERVLRIDADWSISCERIK